MSPSYATNDFHVPLLSQANYTAWRTAIESQMNAKGCWNVIAGTLQAPEAPILSSGTSHTIYCQNRTLECEFRTDSAHYDQLIGLAATLIRSTVSPAAEAFIKAIANPIDMWNCLKEKFSPENNPALLQTIEREFAEV